MEVVQLDILLESENSRRNFDNLIVKLMNW